jgi:hypothetical protein
MGKIDLFMPDFTPTLEPLIASRASMEGAGSKFRIPKPQQDGSVRTPPTKARAWQ